MRPIIFILFLFVAGFMRGAETNYLCVVCGKGPLSGQIWLSKWGAVCDACYKLENHCALCGLPVREGKGVVKTGDGRFICKFDQKNAVLDADTAKEIFIEARRDLASLFGPVFALQYPEVSVNLFGVDYWSEKGRSDGLHKFGFSSTRKTPSGKCTHQVVMLSGQLRDDLAATAAHEYTHLWINENRPAGRVLDADTVEAICETAAYELMESRQRKAQLKKIRENPYTHGVINRLLELDHEHGFRYILDWVKTGEGVSFDSTTAASVRPAKVPKLNSTNAPVALPDALKLGGLLLEGKSSHAVIAGTSFAAGETRSIKLRRGEVRVRCLAIHRDEVTLEADGLSTPFTLKIGEEKFLP